MSEEHLRSLVPALLSGALPFATLVAHVGAADAARVQAVAAAARPAAAPPGAAARLSAVPPF
jgi:hypothetical protein